MNKSCGQSRMFRRRGRRRRKREKMTTKTKKRKGEEKSCSEISGRDA